MESRPRISTLGLNRRTLVKSIVYAGGAVAFAGVGRAPSSVFAQDKVKLVHMYHQYGEEGTQDAVNKYAKDYTAENPNVEIEVVWQLGDYGAALSSALLTDAAPDVFEVNAVTSDMVKQQQVAPLDDLYDDALKEDFGDANLKSATIDGKVYWVKMITDTGAVYYKKSLLEGAGLAVPTTFDELIAAAQKLGEGRQKGLFLGNDGGIGALLGPLVWSAGGRFLTADNKPGFNLPLVAEGFGKLKALNDSGALLMGSTTDYWDPSAFIQGATAMQWTGLWAFPAINEALGDDVGVFPWPASAAAASGSTQASPVPDSGVPSTFWGGWGECVNGKSPNLDAAKAYVKWLWIDNKDVQTDWNVGYGFHVPPRKSAADVAEKLQVGAAADIVKNLYDYGVVESPLWTPAMGTALSTALANVVQNGADPAAELATAEETVNTELSRT